MAGSRRVFMDVEDIPPGVPFAQYIDRTMAQCDIALIVIGPRWAEILKERLEIQQPDYVVHEIEAALARRIRVVPVLVGGAGMEELAGLPAKLASLAQYEGAELRDNTFNEDCARLARSLRLRDRRKRVMALAGGAVLIAFAAGALGLWGPWSEHRARKAAAGQMLATARTQADRSEYQAAFATHRALLKTDPGNRAAMDLQVDAAMGWLRNFQVTGSGGAKAEDIAGSRLDEIMPVLDAALARTGGKGPRAADILAHLGWAHWLNRKLAHREFGPAAERDLRQALRVDPSNVFAHAMLGNYIMQTGGRKEDAIQHFRKAAEPNREREFVRQLQLAVLTYPDDTQTRQELARVANEMRRSGEPLDERQRRRILNTFNPGVNSAAGLRETLSAVPPADAWATYLWLVEEGTAGSDPDQRIRREFIAASIVELEGKRMEARAAFEKILGELKRRGWAGRLADNAEGAVARLSKP